MSLSQFCEFCVIENRHMQKLWDFVHQQDADSEATERPKRDEFWFEPFGYSANMICGKYYLTIHVTPQPCCSYASVETNYCLDRVAELNDVVQEIFGPSDIKLVQIYPEKQRGGRRGSRMNGKCQ